MKCTYSLERRIKQIFLLEELLLLYLNDFSKSFFLQNPSVCPVYYAAVFDFEFYPQCQILQCSPDWNIIDKKTENRRNSITATNKQDFYFWQTKTEEQTANNRMLEIQSRLKNKVKGNLHNEVDFRHLFRMLINRN